jgi:hypothetical protein
MRKRRTTTSLRQFIFAGGTFVLGFSLSTIIQNTHHSKVDLLKDVGLSSVLDFEASSHPAPSTISNYKQPIENAVTSQSATALSNKAEDVKPELPSSINNTTKEVNSLTNDASISTKEKGTTNHDGSTPNENETKKKEEPPTDICSFVSKLPSTSSVSIWRRNLEPIKWTTKHDSDHEFNFHDFHARMMHYLTPQRLQNSVKTLPFNQWEKVGEILDIAFKRYQYVQDQKNGKKQSGGDGKEPRKLRILVMGGSVTAGVYCVENPVLGRPLHIMRRMCAWPRRLEWFLELFFPSVVQVDVAAYGGTNTRGGTTIWEYDLFPEDVPIPDILINAFSTNDMHVISMREAQKQNMTLEDGVLQMNQEFVRKVMKPRSNCNDRPPPLLLYLDDYLGNEQKGILDTLAVNSALHKLSSYYGFGFMSYADIVRDFVYSDTTEEWFSPKDWPERQIHHTAGGHVGIMWVVAYNLLNTVTVYCDSLKIGPEHIYEAIEGLPEPKFPDRVITGEALPKPRHALPPELSSDLTLDNVSTRWHEMERNMTASGFDHESACPSISENKERKSVCHLRMFTINSASKPGPGMMEILAPFVVENDGWEEAASGEKKGLVPSKANASLKLRFDDITDQVQTLNFIAMKSYGEKWEGSTLKVEAFVDRKIEDGGEQPRTPSSTNANAEPLRILEIEGVHDKHTSESYNYKIDLGEERVLAGDVLNVDIRLIGGTTAKIMGMMFCRM